MSVISTSQDLLNDPLGELLAVTERLIEVVAAETAVLRGTPPHNLGNLVADKSRLVVRYDTLMRELSQQKSSMAPDRDRFEVLKGSIARLGVLAKENAAAIDLQMKATRRVLDIIARAANKATQPTFTYGTQRLGYGVRSARNSAVSVNRVL